MQRLRLPLFKNHELLKKTLIHSYDIILPFSLPPNGMIINKIYWGEQCLLYALFLENPNLQALAESYMLSILFLKLINALMYKRYTSDDKLLVPKNLKIMGTII